MAFILDGHGPRTPIRGQAACLRRLNLDIDALRPRNLVASTNLYGSLALRC